MANSFYLKGLEHFLNGELSWRDHDWRADLVDTADYTVNLSTHEFRSDIPSGAIVATTANFSSKTSTLGVADAADTLFPTATGDNSEAMVIYRWTGTNSTSALVLYITTAAGLPIAPSGTNINITWPNTSDRIFRLGQ
jgi:hypothetical protein